MRKIRSKVILRERLPFSNGGFKYGFDTFDSAKKWISSLGFAGYEEENFIQKLYTSASLVRDGKATYERDTVIFPRIQYAWELLASLLIVSKGKRRVKIIDFGGGLGTTFWQNSSMLNLAGVETSWIIIEQKRLVEIGKSEFESDFLKFVPSLADVVSDEIDAVLFGGSLCYLENPYDILNQTFLLGPHFIIFDRTPFRNISEDTIAVQFVPKSIYKAAYPIRIFSIAKFNNFMNREYELIEQWDCIMQPDPNSSAMGSLWRKRIK
jgi:putative methyltransferase (TIGR04325 family)